VVIGGLVLATLTIAALTWSGPKSVFPLAGSLTATYAMFHLRGARLRMAMVLVNAFWMVNAVAYDAWWQIAANAISGTAAAVGAWRLASGQRDKNVRSEEAARADEHCCFADCSCRAGVAGE
jgi:hypothetical protein